MFQEETVVARSRIDSSGHWTHMVTSIYTPTLGLMIRRVGNPASFFSPCSLLHRQVEHLLFPVGPACYRDPPRSRKRQDNRMH